MATAWLETELDLPAFILLHLLLCPQLTCLPVKLKESQKSSFSLVSCYWFERPFRREKWEPQQLILHRNRTAASKGLLLSKKNLKNRKVKNLTGAPGQWLPPLSEIWGKATTLLSLNRKEAKTSFLAWKVPKIKQFITEHFPLWLRGAGLWKGRIPEFAQKICVSSLSQCTLCSLP